MSGGLGRNAVNTEMTEIKAEEGGWKKVGLLFGRNGEGVSRDTWLRAAGRRQSL